MATHKFKLLIVEDDDLVRDMLSQHFEDGFDVILASDGREGLRQLEIHKPDLIITDIVMPNMSGTEMTVAIKALHPDIKIVAISGGGRKSVDLSNINAAEASKIIALLDSSEASGAVMSLQKPVGIQDLSMAVNLLLMDPAKRKSLLKEEKVS